jgi:hypothetical protein
MTTKLIEVYRARGEVEAKIIQSKLEAFNIPSVIRSHAAPSVLVLTVDGLSEYRVMVPEEYAAEASGYLAEEEHEEDEEDS